MPFIDEDLLWCPDNDARMVDLQACLQDANGQNQPSDASSANGCDLNNLEESLCNDSDDLLRQLTENTFELEQFFQDFPVTEIKVEENNNDLQLDEETSGQIFLQSCSQLLTSAAAVAVANSHLNVLAGDGTSLSDALLANGANLLAQQHNNGANGGSSAESHLQEQLFLVQAQGLLQHQQQQQQQLAQSQQHQQQHQNRLHQLATNTLLAEKLLHNQTTLTALDGAGIPTSIAVTAAVVQGNGRAGKPPDIVIKGKVCRFATASVAVGPRSDQVKSIKIPAAR
ncbi:ecdysone-induced protein 74EF-like isoform X2 [Armigeres subalbatus]|uniref:ecdysone-induced protein 74EF-like isoform X2 n=1 Tax=Armigeres subalbatus TaxID=124917 RepID=UPI002ED1AE69